MRKTRPKVFVILFANIGAFLFSGAGLPQSFTPPESEYARPRRLEGGEVAQHLRSNVVQIEGRENGFGFIVGERDGTLYVVTANHVVRDPEAVDAKGLGKVKVEFFEKQGETYEAKLLGTHDVAHDLAVLTVPLLRGVRWENRCFGEAEDQKRPTPVWFIGRGQKWYVPVSPGHVASEAPVDSRIDVENLGVRRGSSGGPLIAATGIIGMIQKDSADDAKALTIDFIKATLLRWRHPWGLLAAAIQPPPAPSLKPKATPRQSLIDRGFLFRFSGCSLSGSEVSCDLTITNKEDDRFLSLESGPSRIIDEQGREYRASRAAIGASRESAATLPTGVVMVGKIQFEGVHPGTTRLQLLEIHYSFGSAGNWTRPVVKFHNIDL